MKKLKMLFVALITFTILTSSMMVKTHAEDLSQYYALSNQLLQMAAILQAQAQQLMPPTGIQQDITYQPQIQQVAMNPVDIQAQQALMAQQAMAAQQAALVQQQQQAALLAAQQVQQLAPVVNSAPVQTAVNPQNTMQSGDTGNADNFNTWDEAQRQNQTGIIVLNTKTMKIHNPWCRSVPKIAPENYAESTLSVDELIAQGYDKCKQEGDW